MKNGNAKSSIKHSFDIRLRPDLIDIDNPEKHINELKAQGFNRIIYPFHWQHNVNKNTLAFARRWVEIAHHYGMQLLMYTGPFGTELAWFLKNYPKSSNWLQIEKDGSPVKYDKGGCMVMCCPASPYLREYRRPLMETFLEKTGADGFFLDIPWVLDNACYCDNCKELKASVDESVLTANEQMVRMAIENDMMDPICKKFPHCWAAVNIGSTAIWHKDLGGTPRALSGLFDEYVTEWTAANDDELGVIINSIQKVRKMNPDKIISHAFGNDQAGELRRKTEIILETLGVGKWLA